MWTSERRLYLDKAGNVVEADDPTRTSLLVSAGGQIPLAQARALGLVRDPKPMPAEPVAEPVAKAVEPAKDKAVKAPAKTKAKAKK